MKALLRWLVLLLSVGVSSYGMVAYLAMEPGATVHPEMRAAFAAHPARILVHVVCSALALVVGPLQFFPGLRSRRTLHRTLGWIYAGAVFGGGVSGFATAFIAFGGLSSRLGFGLLAIVWLVATAAAIRAAMVRDFVCHERWALRSFGLTFAAVTLRIHLGVFLAAGMPFEAFYPALAWLCWVPNLLLVEWVLIRRGAAVGASL